MPKFKDTDYLHISARIKYLETKLLGKDSFEKLIDARSAAEALKILTDNGYNGSGELFDKPENFESLLTAELENVYDFLLKYTGRRLLVDIFRLPYDYLNIKALLKAEFMNIAPDNMLNDTGTISKSRITAAFADRNASILGQKMTEAIASASEAMAKTGDPQQIDLIIDILCFEDMLRQALNSEFDFLADYLYTRIDLINILTFIRQRRIGKDRRFFSGTYIRGRLGPEFYTELYELPIHSFYEALLLTPFKALGGRFSSSENLSITDAELAVDEYIGDIIKSMRKVPFGPQIPVAYLLSKEAEIKNIRIIMTGKIAGLKSDIIRGRLRLGYV